MSKFKTCSISIPHTKRHIKFIEECQEELKKTNIPHEFVVDENYDAQESWVRIMCNEKDDDVIAGIVDTISKRK